MTAQPIVGIDPGANGAIFVLDESGGFVSADDMPATKEANGRTVTNAPLLAGILARTHARIVYCEFAGVRPTDAKASAFQFGRARGCIEGVCGALGVPIVFITPPVWKRIADIPPGAENKDLARTRAIVVAQRRPADNGAGPRKIRRRPDRMAAARGDRP